jgi:uncharacterized repeat protein (TIGR03803 family)
LFSVTTKGAYSLLRNLDGGNDGTQPNGGIDIDAAGNLYGTAAYGGVHGGGTLWKYVPGTGMTTVHAFGAAGDGATPLQGAYRLANGVIIGSAAGGAVNTNGDVWRLFANGTYKSIHNFQSSPTDGHCPFSGVALASNGTIYGTVIGWGFGGIPNGAVWQIGANGKFQTIYTFKNGNDGEYPDQAPVVDASGTVYGTTHEQNGTAFAGAIWAIQSTGFKVLHDLTAATDGFEPNSPLLLDSDGNLYGTTDSGGPGGYGTVFQITPAGAFKVMHAFTGGKDGANPTGMLAHDYAGAIYGGTASGQVYKIVP